MVGIAGKKRGAEPWPAGAYRAVAEVLRAGAVVGKAEKMLQLQ
jgi:hypothetical protein